MNKSIKEVLIAALQEERLNFQILNQCCTGVKQRKKPVCTEVSFLTDALTPDNVVKGDGKIGYILWIDPAFVTEINERT